MAKKNKIINGICCNLLPFFFTIIFVFNSFQSYSQKHGKAKIDSLLLVLITQKEDTNKVHIYRQLCYEYSGINPDEGFKYGNLGLELANKLVWNRGKAMILMNIAINYKQKGDYNSALEYNNRSLKLFEELGIKRGIAGVYGNIGDVYLNKGEFDSALTAYKSAITIFDGLKQNGQIGNDDKKKMARLYSSQQISYLNISKYKEALVAGFSALKLNEEINDKAAIAYSNINISVVCERQKQFDKALEYCNKALNIFIELKDNINIAKVDGNIANVYLGKNNFDSALVYYKKAISIYQANGDKSGIAVNFVNIGELYKKINNYPKALESYFDALKLLEELKDVEDIKILEGNIGDTYLLIAKDTSNNDNIGPLVPKGRTAILNKAIEYLNKCIAGCKESGDIAGVSEYSQYLSEAYKLSGNYAAALDNFILSTTLKDSINSIDNKKELTKQETQAKKEIADKQIQLDLVTIEKKKNEDYFLYAGIVVLLFVIGLVLRSNIKQNKSNKIITREKNRSEELLLNILPSEVAEELKDKGSAEAKFFNEVTVLFTDFVGFTTVAERMTPQQLVNELDGCFRGFDHIMGKYNIEKIKTVGDAYLAVCGLPMPNEEHAANVVNAALELREFMAERKKQLGDLTFQVRIGVHSGSVVAGIVGVKKFAYDIWGDTVNTAARMEQNSTAGKINISEVTHELIKDKFECTYRGKIQAKNKGELSMYFVENALIAESEIV